MLAVIESTVPVFAVVVLGFGLRKSGFIRAEFWGAVEDLCFYVFFPTLLAKTMIEADLKALSAGPFVATLLVSVAIIAVTLLLLWPLLRRFLGTGAPQFTTIFQTTTRWHGFIALAIVLNLYGAEGGALIALTFAVLVPVLQVSNIMVLAAFSTTEAPGLRSILRRIVTNPIIWGISLGLLVNFLGLPVWPPVMDTLDLLGRSALGASLLTLGAGLSLKAALNPSRELWVGVIGKLVFTPLVMMGVATVFGIDGVERNVLLVSAAVPTAMNGFVLARKMGGDAPLYATISTVQVVLSFVTIPLWLLLLQQ